MHQPFRRGILNQSGESLVPALNLNASYTTPPQMRKGLENIEDSCMYTHCLCRFHPPGSSILSSQKQSHGGPNIDTFILWHSTSVPEPSSASQNRFLTPFTCYSLRYLSQIPFSPQFSWSATSSTCSGEILLGSFGQNHNNDFKNAPQQIKDISRIM